MLACDLDYRKRFGGWTLRPLTLQNILPTALATGMLVVAVILLVLSLR
jgi:hypothetical protein